MNKIDIKISVKPLSIAETQEFLKRRKYKNKDLLMVGELDELSFGYLLETKNEAVIISPNLIIKS